MIYDEFNRRLTMENNLGEKVTTIYDAEGNVAETITSNPDASEVSKLVQQYDPLNCLTATELPHDANTDVTVQRAYDLAGKESIGSDSIEMHDILEILNQSNLTPLMQEQQLLALEQIQCANFYVRENVIKIISVGKAIFNNRLIMGSKECPNCNNELNYNELSDEFNCPHCGIELNSNRAKINVITIIISIFLLPVVMNIPVVVLSFLGLHENSYGIAIGIIGIVYGLLFMLMRELFVRVKLSK